MTQDEPRPPEGSSNSPAKTSLLPIFIVVTVLTVAGFVIVPALQADMRASSIRGFGAERAGRVVEIEDTGNRFNNDPVVIVTIEIEEKGRLVRGTIKDAISPVHLPRFQPGATVKVWIDPDHPSEMALEEGL